MVGKNLPFIILRDLDQLSTTSSEGLQTKRLGLDCISHLLTGMFTLIYRLLATRMSAVMYGLLLYLLTRTPIKCE